MEKTVFKVGHTYRTQDVSDAVICGIHNGKLFGRVGDMSCDWDAETGAFRSDGKATGLDLIAPHPLDALIADLRDAIDGGEECRGRDQQISEWIRLAEQARSETVAK